MRGPEAKAAPRALHRLRQLARGFTLLEVMVTLAILGMSLVAISRSQQNSIRAANRAKWMTVAVMLARYKMVEAEDTLFEEGFSDFDEKETGDFKDEGFDRYTYSLKVDKIELPASMNADSLVSAFGGSGDADSDRGDAESKQQGMMSLGAQMLSKQFEMIRNVLEQSIRRVEVTVEWQEGTQTRVVSVAGYFTDPRKIDAAAAGTLTTGTGTTDATSGTGSTSATGARGGVTTTPTATPRTGGTVR
jgi:prepilin-type N-terminal cleavage/methylation domain-containing protein